MSTLSNGPGFAIVPLPLLVTVVENLIICWWLYCVGYTFPAFVMESRIAWDLSRPNSNEDHRPALEVLSVQCQE